MFTGHELDPQLDEVDKVTGRTRFEEIVLAVASGRMSKDGLIAFLRDHTRPI